MSSEPVPPTPPSAIKYASMANAPSRAGLVAVGVVLLFFGIGAGCLAAMMPMVALIPNTPKQDTRYIVMAALMYLAISAGLVWLGVGACRAKRWIRPMILALGWPMVIVGVVGLLSFVFTIPAFMEMMGSGPGAQALPPGVRIAAAAGAILFQAVLMVGAPLAMVLYIRRPKTEQILSYYDPKKNWTDDCPLPVLTWAMALAVAGVLALVGLARPGIPVPGGVVHGLPAVAIILAIAVGLLWLAYGSYRLEMGAWWASLVVSIIGSAWGMVITLSGAMVEYWKDMGTDQRQVEFMRQTSGSVTSTVMYVAMAVLTIGYILAIRKHFVKTPGESAVGPGGAAAI